MRATGIKYASQQFEIDGCSVKVRIAGEQEFIELSGGAGSLAMDSGIFDVGTFAPANPGRYAPGALFEAGPVAGYNAVFTHDALRGPGRTNPSTSSAGQLTGIITKTQKFSGRILEQQAFSPQQIDPPLVTNPASKIPDPADDLLHLKKAVAVLCPPSVFTGRCRLYVQSLFGLPLYEYDKSGATSKTNYPPTLVDNMSGAPSLEVNSYVMPGDTSTYHQVGITTSCGVWLDTRNGKHWLIAPNGGVTKVYPLVSSIAGEVLRKELIPGKSSLNEIDRGHLESYILAYSLPDVARHLDADMANVPGGIFSMGYGWHWNWSGTAADIVTNGTYDQGGGHSGMVSSHYRLDLTCTSIPEPSGGFLPSDPRWAFSIPMTLLEGPSQWAMYRYFWTIAEPDFSAGILVKTTPKLSDLIEGSAPFYAFYQRDKLVMCRTSVKHTPAHTPEPYGTEGFDNGNLRTYGMDGGTYTVPDYIGQQEKLTISIGELTFSDIPHAAVTTGSITTLGNKVNTGETGPGWDFGSNYVHSVEYGNISNGRYQLTAQTDCRDNPSYTAGVNYDIKVTMHREESVGQVSIAVPLYDAEAIYVQASIALTKSSYGQTQAWSAWQNGYNYLRYVHIIYVDYLTGMDTGSAILEKYGWEYGGGPSGAAMGALTVDADTTSTSYSMNVNQLVCGKGTFPATMDHLNEFHSNDLEQIGTGYYTTSGCSTTTPVVIAPGLITPANPGGVDTAASTPRVMTGWV